MTAHELFWLAFIGFVPLLLSVALLFGWWVRRRRMHYAQVFRTWRRRRPMTTLGDLSRMAEFQRRHRRYLYWCWAGLGGGGVALIALKLPLTAVALVTLLPLMAAIEHLRCPECESTATIRGLTDGPLCRRCGYRIKP